jgi:hypothetical protein
MAERLAFGAPLTRNYLQLSFYLAYINPREFEAEDAMSSVENSPPTFHISSKFCSFEILYILIS